MKENARHHVWTNMNPLRIRYRRPAWNVFGVIAAAAVVVLCVRVVTEAPGRGLTSDESLYLSEAVSIAHGRVTYASGDPIVHRPPLYSATLAPVMAATGNDVELARVVPLLYALGALAAVFWLATLLFDRRVAFVAVALAATSSGTARLSGAYFVDTPATMWLLLSVAVLLAASRAAEGHRVAHSAASGALLGLAFLTKETAIAWAPLPILLVLVMPPERRLRLRALAAWYGSFLLPVIPWFGWVAWQSEAIFKLEGWHGPEVAAGAAVALVCVGAWRRSTTWGARKKLMLAGALAAGWCVLLLVALESRPEPGPARYWATVPGWSIHVFATSVEPWALVVVAWVYAVWRATRGDEDGRVLILIAALGAPLYVYAADRGWELRQVIWLAYLSYLVLAWALVCACDAVAVGWTRWQRHAFAGAVAFALAAVAGFASDLRLQENGAGVTIDWSGPEERLAASWIAELPAGATVISSRVFSTQLYVSTDGQQEIVQLPTLGARITEEGVAPFGTLFRYDDANVDLQAARQWMYLRAYPGRPYAIGLSEADLIASLQAHRADYLLLSGDDAAFSSLSYRAYFDANAAFRLVRATDVANAGGVSSYLYRVDRGALALRSPPLALSGADFAAFTRRWGSAAMTEDFWRALAPSGVALDGYQQLSPGDAGDLARQLAGSGDGTSAHSIDTDETR